MKYFIQVVMTFITQLTFRLNCEWTQWNCVSRSARRTPRLKISPSVPDAQKRKQSTSREFGWGPIQDAFSLSLPQCPASNNYKSEKWRSWLFKFSSPFYFLWHYHKLKRIATIVNTVLALELANLVDWPKMLPLKRYFFIHSANCSNFSFFVQKFNFDFPSNCFGWNLVKLLRFWTF